MARTIQESQGVILFTKNHREKDKLVKIFTERYGKIMFFAKNVQRKNHPLAAAILPFTSAVYIGDIREEGLSFLNAAREVKPYLHLQQDIFLNAYATYLLSLVDAAIDDQVYDPFLFAFTKQALDAIEVQLDPEIITNIFEIQILTRFGIQLNWDSCAICGETEGAFDFSMNYHGVLCQKHFESDPRRSHFAPRALHFMSMFSRISYQNIQNIKVSDETKRQIRFAIDQLYEEYVGIHLRSKKFIDDMKQWEATLKNPLQEENSDLDK